VYGGRKMSIFGPAATKGKLWCTWTSNGNVCGGAFDSESLIIVDADVEKSRQEFEGDLPDCGPAADR
jgi:hypothetical protein